VDGDEQGDFGRFLDEGGYDCDGGAEWAGCCWWEWEWEREFRVGLRWEVWCEWCWCEWTLGYAGRGGLCLGLGLDPW